MSIDYNIYFVNTIGKANIIYWFLIKYKRVICNVLAAELYGIVHKFVIRVVIKLILEKILSAVVLLILCTNSKFSYNHLIKLGISYEKQVMVDVIGLHQSYKQ